MLSNSKIKYFLKGIKFIIHNFRPKKIGKAFKILITQGPKGVIRKIEERKLAEHYRLTVNQEYQVWLKKNYPTKKQLEKQRKESKKFKYKPKISIITPVYNPPEKFLRECIESVINQSYDNWELCLVDDASSNPKVREIIKEYAQKDKRIKYKFRRKNGHICKASNDALKLATGEFIGLLDHDDILWPNALYKVIKLLNKKPHAQFIYSDEDKLDFDGKTHVDPFFKPDWSPDYLRSINYITHFAVIKKDLVDKIGGFRVGTEGAQDWDLFLRATWWLEKNVGHCHPLDPKNPIQHIPTVLYSWRKSSSSTASDKHVEKVKKYAYANQLKIMRDHLKRVKPAISKYLDVIPSQNLGLIYIKMKKSLVKKFVRELFININVSKAKKVSLIEEFAFVPFLFNKNVVLFPQKIEGNIVYNHKKEILFFKESPQPFPHLLKKDAFFDYIIEGRKDVIKKNKLLITTHKLYKLYRNNQKSKRIRYIYIVESPFFRYEA